MKPVGFSALNDDWEANDDSYASPDTASQWEQSLIFGQVFKNGSISTDIELHKGRKSRQGQESREAELLFRYSGYEGSYYAGLGAWRTKFFIGKVLPGPVYQLLGAVGSRDSIRIGKTYRLRIECYGSQITLFDNDVRQLVVYDGTYQTGQWGLRTWGTAATFSSVETSLSKPVCFVIMPFSTELDFVYGVMKETVERHGLKFVRSDDTFVARPVVEDLKSQIAEADLVIVDFTGKNPNVYYEAGLADAWKKKWIVLAQSPDDLTFDVRHIRTILYSNKMGADDKLRDNLAQALREAGFDADRSVLPHAAC